MKTYPETVRQAALADYANSSATCHHIAHKHGVSTATLTVWAKRAKLPLRSRGRNRRQRPSPLHRKMLRLRQEGKTYTEIGEELGKHKQQVFRVVKRFGNTPDLSMKAALLDAIKKRCQLFGAEHLEEALNEATKACGSEVITLRPAAQPRSSGNPFIRHFKKGATLPKPKAFYFFGA